MTVFNFPDTAGQPIDGTFTWTAPNGLLYSWDGDAWRTDTGNANLDDKYVNIIGDTMTGDLTVPSLNGGQLAGLRNQLINGDFRVWQRGTDFSIGTGGDAKYLADRWFGYSTTSAIGQNKTDTPAGFTYAMVTKAANQALPIRQSVELPLIGKAGAFAVGSQWTVSFWAKGSGTGHVYDITAGFAQASNVEPTTTPLNVAGQALTTAWTKYSHTFTITANPDPVDTCFSITFALKNGTGFNYITGIQLEPGPVATPFEHRPIGLELSLCQRYYQNLGTSIVQYNVRDTINQRHFYFTNQTVKMRPNVDLGTAGSCQFSSNFDTTTEARTFGPVEFRVSSEGNVLYYSTKAATGGTGTPLVYGAWAMANVTTADAEL